MRENVINLYYLVGVLVIFGCFFANGCATGVSPLEKISTVEMTIQQARENNAITHAPLELKLAEEKLIKSKMAVEDGDLEQAQIMAEKALADARYAEAKSRAANVKMLVQEMRTNIDALRREANRPRQGN